MSSALGKKRSAERDRYRALYEKRVFAKPGVPYGIANHGSEALDILVYKYNADSICDVGTGDGAFCRSAADKGISRVYGVDFASRPKGINVHWIQAYAHNLPFSDDEVDWVTAFDVLEHLHEEEIDEVLNEFARVARVGMAFSIAYIPSHEVMGRNLHLTVRPQYWWLERLRRYGEVDEHIRRLPKSWKEIIKDYQFVRLRQL